MHKEVIKRSRIRILISILMVIVVALYLENLIDIFRFKGNSILNSGDLFIWFVVIMILAYEILSVNLKYKYSIIADKLIVNRRIFKKEKNLISIKVKDILYVGEKKDMPKELKGKHIGKYTCNIIQYGDKVCVFKNGDSLYKFNFNASELLVGKLNAR